MKLILLILLIWHFDHNAFLSSIPVILRLFNIRLQFLELGSTQDIEILQRTDIKIKIKKFRAAELIAGLSQLVSVETELCEFVDVVNLFMNILMRGDCLVVPIQTGSHEENTLPGCQIFFEIVIISDVFAHRLLGIFLIVLHEVRPLLFGFNFQLVDELPHKVVIFVFVLDVQVRPTALEVEFI